MNTDARIDGAIAQCYTN